jgi:hypothetical protein
MLQGYGGSQCSFVTGFARANISAATGWNPDFVVPSFYNAARRITAPQYQEWNLELQQGFGTRTTLSLNYVGNHGVHEAVQNPGLNAFNPVAFGDLPLQSPDQRFGTITEVGTYAVSNYNGLTVSAKHQASSLQLQANTPEPRDR